MPTELTLAIALANKVLHRIGADPDDDLAVLARQFLLARAALVREKDKSSSLIGRYIGRRTTLLSRLLRGLN